MLMKVLLILNNYWGFKKVFHFISGLEIRQIFDEHIQESIFWTYFIVICINIFIFNIYKVIFKTVTSSIPFNKYLFVSLVWISKSTIRAVMYLALCSPLLNTVHEIKIIDCSGDTDDLWGLAFNLFYPVLGLA